MFIGTLFILRKPVIEEGSTFTMIISVPSFLLGGFLFKMTHSFQNLSPFIEGLFFTGVAITIFSFFYLGKNFAICPNLREVTTKGPYQQVRHPGYFGEMLMTLACCMVNTSFLSVIAFLLFIGSLILRIREEEKLLSKTVEYQTYKSVVKWRLVPYVW
ncbi:methyltransferase family protein [Flammeovirga aprica]|uniref:Isoprenylcysteine carboxylmethyltransferase family protein n=1 Tax=Flammeovirga aprica JL-4 TaxID=694437 RepID=A0A7X9P1Q2_9BACT|nr:isoprenylcysteine carboxylmethyltransferase family protein [Flammeovirga aprica]NME67941.1 isoprenylcysteine carboxylmethyltransferase family protein [Flammeovirga aprica JL-4]